MNNKHLFQSSKWFWSIVKEHIIFTEMPASPVPVSMKLLSEYFMTYMFLKTNIRRTRKPTNHYIYIQYFDNYFLFIYLLFYSNLIHSHKIFRSNEVKSYQMSWITLISNKICSNDLIFNILFIQVINFVVSMFLITQLE